MENFEFIEYVKKEFNFLITEFDFKIEKEIKDQLVYGVLYKNTSKAIQVYYEVLDQLSFVMIFRLNNGELPAWDDTANAVPLHKISDFVSTVYEIDKSVLPPAFDRDTYKKNSVLNDLNKKARSLKRIAKIIITDKKWISFPEIDKPQSPTVWNPED